MMLSLSQNIDDCNAKQLLKTFVASASAIRDPITNGNQQEPEQESKEEEETEEDNNATCKLIEQSRIVSKSNNS